MLHGIAFKLHEVICLNDSDRGSNTALGLLRVYDPGWTEKAAPVFWT